MPWKLTKFATRWSPGTGSRSWRWYTRMRGNRARTPRCCYRSYSHPRRQPRNAVRGTRVCDVITHDTSTVISTRRRRTKYPAPDVASITKVPSMRCSKPCPNDKDQANERKVLSAVWYRWTASYPDVLGIAWILNPLDVLLNANEDFYFTLKLYCCRCYICCFV